MKLHLMGCILGFVGVIGGLTSLFMKLRNKGHIALIPFFFIQEQHLLAYCQTSNKKENASVFNIN